MAMTLSGWASIAISTVVLLQASAKAQVPQNDECASASGVAVIQLPFSATIDTAPATTAPSDPIQSCGAQGPAQNANSVWFRFTADNTGVVIANTFGSNYDTVLTVYDGACETLAERACSDDAGDPQSFLVAPVTAGQTIVFEVTQSGSAGGGRLVFNLDAQPPLPNDACISPTVVGSLPFTDTIDTTTATSELSDPLQSCTAGGASRSSNSVWYSYTADADETIAADTVDSGYDTVLTAYTGACGALTEVACSEGGTASQVLLSLSAGESIRFEITSRLLAGSPGGGTLVFNVHAVVGPTPTPSLQPTPTSTPVVVEPTATATPTPTEAPAPCVGDCGGGGDVTVDELLTMVNIALGNGAAIDCVAGDASGDGQITVDEIVTALNNALSGCHR